MQNNNNATVDTKKTKLTILVVDDEPDITLVLKVGLDLEAFKLIHSMIPKKHCQTFCLTSTLYYFLILKCQT